MNRTHESWPDFAKSFAILAVIIIHVSAPLVLSYTVSDKSNWLVANFFDSFSRFCVPVFLMISGALLLPKQEPVGLFFKKRLSRILIPFLFWSIVYAIYHWNEKYPIAFDTLFTLEMLSYIGNQLIVGADFHMWYIYMLLGVYLTYPILRVFTRNADKSELKYFLIIWLLLQFLKLHWFEQILPSFSLPLFAGYIGYPVLGFYLNQHYTLLQKDLYKWMLYIVGSLTIVSSTAWYTFRNGEFYNEFYEFLSIPVIVTSGGAFLIFRTITISRKPMRSFLHKVSSLSFGIYLSHVLVLYLLYEAFPQMETLSSWLYITVLTLACFFGSLALTHLLSLIPVLKKISGAS